MRASLTKTQFLVLACLARRPMHIYAIRQEIFILTDHFYYPSGSTLKQAVNALLKKKLLQACHSNPNYWLMARRGVPYELTEAGEWALDREVKVYFKLCQLVRMWKNDKLAPLW